MEKLEISSGDYNQLSLITNNVIYFDNFKRQLEETSLNRVLLNAADRLKSFSIIVEPTELGMFVSYLESKFKSTFQYEAASKGSLTMYLKGNDFGFGYSGVYLHLWANQPFTGFDLEVCYRSFRNSKLQPHV